MALPCLVAQYSSRKQVGLIAVLPHVYMSFSWILLLLYLPATALILRRPALIAGTQLNTLCYCPRVARAHQCPADPEVTAYGPLRARICTVQVRIWFEPYAP